MAKNDHMLAILWLLAPDRKITAKQISEKLEINIRSVYRYIDALCSNGVPVVADSGPGGGYTILKEFITSPLIFDSNEQKALAHAAVFAREAGYPFDESLVSALDKLKKHLNQEQESELGRHIPGFEVISNRFSPETKRVLVALEQAIADETTVEIGYRSRRNEQPQNRQIDPYGMFYSYGKWYTVAFCHLRKEIRSFRADRILSIQRTQASFKRPEAFSAKKFFQDSLLSEVAQEEEFVPLVVKGREEALDDLCIHWFLGNYLKERIPNQARFVIDKRAMYAHVPFFILSYGKALWVVEPKSLRQRLVEISSEMAEYYHEDTITGSDCP